jgi:hypothetical protein
MVRLGTPVHVPNVILHQSSPSPPIASHCGHFRAQLHLLRIGSYSSRWKCSPLVTVLLARAIDVGVGGRAFLAIGTVWVAAEGMTRNKSTTSTQLSYDAYKTRYL